MKRPRVSPRKPPDAKQARRSALVTEAAENPFRFFTTEDTGLIFDLGMNVMTALRALGAPVIARKMNPVMLMEWLKENHDRVPKIRGND
jgi:hypothetical protein